MRYIVLCIVAIAAVVAIWCAPTSVETTRDLEFEAYCDSIWEADPNYYYDVLVESDEYQIYIETNGEW